jgi:hypothetical protein
VEFLRRRGFLDPAAPGANRAGVAVGPAGAVTDAVGGAGVVLEVAPPDHDVAALIVAGDQACLWRADEAELDHRPPLGGDADPAAAAPRAAPAGGPRSDASPSGGGTSPSSNAPPSSRASGTVSSPGEQPAPRTSHAAAQVAVAHTVVFRCRRMPHLRSAPEEA